MDSNKPSRLSRNFLDASPLKNLISPKNISRKPEFVKFAKKKHTQISQIQSSDRIRFISPTRANLSVNQSSLLVQNSLEFNQTQYSSKEPINYPFIKKCVSPKFLDNSYSRKMVSRDQNLKQQSSLPSTVLQPSIKNFSNCELVSSIRNDNLLKKQISELKKRNFQLNLLLDERNQLIEKQKQFYDAQLAKFSQQLLQNKKEIQISQKKFVEIQNKMIHYQSKSKQLQVKFSQTTEKLDKAHKEIKMYKAKFRINFSNGKEKQKDQLKCSKYHQNCCKTQHNTKSTKNQQNQCTKPYLLKQSRKDNIIEAPSHKKIKSQNILTACSTTSFESTNEFSRLMKISYNQEEFSGYIELKIQLENLVKEIHYKDIEILTLKKAKCEFEKQKQNYEKVKKFNRKLLNRVQFLTKQRDVLENKKRLSVPLEVSSKKKFIIQYEGLNAQQEEQCRFYETIDLQLSPEKDLKESQKFSLRNDMRFNQS